MASISSSSAAHGASNEPTQTPRTRIDIHNTLTTFIHLQDGEKSVKQLYQPMADNVMEQHDVIYTATDVGAVIRAAGKTGARILLEKEKRTATEQQYYHYVKYVAEHAQTREQKAKLKADKQWLYDEYNHKVEHHHSPLALAQLALHKALVEMRERGAIAVEGKKKEKAKLKAYDRQMKEEEHVAKRQKRQQEKEAKEAKAREQREKKEAKAVLGARAVNAILAQDLASHRKSEYDRKKKESAKRMEFMKLATELMSDVLKKNKEERTEEKKSEAKAECSDDEKENQMPQ
jgi:hypothetical protein